MLSYLTRTPLILAALLAALAVSPGCRQRPKEPVKPPPAGKAALPQGVLRKPLLLPRYGTLSALHPVPVSDAQGLVLLLSDKPSPLAPEIAKKAVVLEIPTRVLRRQGEADPARCWYMADDLEMLAQSAQRLLGFGSYLRPLIYADGTASALAYLAMAQAPAEMFSGLLATDLRLQVDFRTPFCERAGWKAWSEGGIILLSPRSGIAPRPDGTPRLKLAPANQVDLTAFIAEMPAAAPLQPAQVTAEIDAWLSSSGDPIADTRPGPEALSALDLPLIVSWPEDPRSALIYLTGDGGWTDSDRSMAEVFVREGHAVVALDTLRYFWTPRSPLQTATDLSRILNAVPLPIPLFIGGRGQGAAVAAASLRRLESVAAARLRGGLLLSPSNNAAFEVSPAEWARSSRPGASWPVQDFLRESPLPLLCIHPTDHADSPCVLPAAAPTADGAAGAADAITVRALPGGATYGGDMATVAHTALSFILDRLPAPPGSVVQKKGQ